MQRLGPHPLPDQREFLALGGRIVVLQIVARCGLHVVAPSLRGTSFQEVIDFLVVHAVGFLIFFDGARRLHTKRLRGIFLRFSFAEVVVSQVGIAGVGDLAKSGSLVDEPTFTQWNSRAPACRAWAAPGYRRQTGGP